MGNGSTSLGDSLSVRVKTRVEDSEVLTLIFIKGLPEPIAVDGDIIHRVYNAMSGSHKCLYLKEEGIVLKSLEILGAMRVTAK